MPTSSSAPRRTVHVGGLEISWEDGLLEPRPWTAHQSAWAAELLRTAPPGPVLELCSGAGHIGLLGVRDHPERRLVAVDIDPLAAEVGTANARAAGLAERVEHRTGALDAVLRPEERFAVVVADPPWVPHRETGRFPADPVRAIAGGPDGLELARRCLRVTAAHLLPGGSCLLQLGTRAQAAELRSWLAGTDLDGPEPDGSGGVPLAVAELRDHAPDGVLLRLLPHR